MSCSRPAPSRTPRSRAPFLLRLDKNAEHKQALEFLYAGQGIGRPFIAPPDMPPAVIKIVRDAFAATMKDPDSSPTRRR